MNTAHVLAWLTCLALAFFACILAVRNAGGVLARKQEVAQLRKKVDQKGRISEHQFKDEVQRMQRSLEQIAEELRALRKAEGGSHEAGLKEKLRALETQISDLREKIDNPAGKE